jgi:hypothetical protein
MFKENRFGSKYVNIPANNINNNNNNNNNNNSIQFFIFVCRVNSYKANYRHSTVYISMSGATVDHIFNQKPLTKILLSLCRVKDGIKYTCNDLLLSIWHQER